MMGVAVGDVLPLVPDPTDPSGAATTIGQGRSSSGSSTSSIRHDPYWSDDTTLERPTLRALSADAVFTNAIALLAPEAYPALMAASDERGLPLHYAWRFLVDPTRLQGRQVDELLTDLRRLESVFPATAPSTGPAEATTLRSGLLRLVDAQQARWRSAQAVLTTVAIGPAMVAGAALGLVVLLGSSRRRAALGLSRSRGASPFQVIGATIAEGIVLTLPAAIVALALALALVPVGTDPLSVAIPLGGRGADDRAARCGDRPDRPGGGPGPIGPRSPRRIRDGSSSSSS